jgi:nucleoid-associated protein YgaU
MRVRTRSACVVLAWGILLLLLAAGSTASPRSAQANNRIASNTSNISNITLTQATLTSSPTHRATLTNSPKSQVTLTDSLASRQDAAAASPAAAHTAPQREARTGTGTTADAGRYVVQPGDTLSGIATALATRGGWPALYAANRQIIGPDPDIIRSGAVLALPGRAAPSRYTVAAGDTLAGIAAALGTHGGWPGLYAANQQVIGPDPNAITAGTVLTIPYPTPPASASPATRPGHRPSPAPATAPPPAPTQPPGAAQPSPSARPRASSKAPAATDLPQWLEIVLLAAAVLIGTAFLTEWVLAIARRRRRAARPAAHSASAPASGPAACSAPPDPRILLADYDRLVVTSSGPDGTVCVLRPPGADPEVILLAARLVLPQDRYEELAGHLGMAAHGRRE